RPVPAPAVYAQVYLEQSGPRPLADIWGWACGETLGECGPGQAGPVPLGALQFPLDQAFGHATLAQLLAQAQRAVTALAAGMHVRLAEALIAEQTFFLQTIELDLRHVTGGPAKLQLAQQLGVTVFASGQQIHRRPADRRRRVQLAAPEHLIYRSVSCRRQHSLQPQPCCRAWAAARRGWPARFPRRFADSLRGSVLRWPCPDRSCCPCSCTRHQTSRSGRSARPGR